MTGQRFRQAVRKPSLPAVPQSLTSRGAVVLLSLAFRDLTLKQDGNMGFRIGRLMRFILIRSTQNDATYSRTGTLTDHSLSRQPRPRVSNDAAKRNQPAGCAHYTVTVIGCLDLNPTAYASLFQQHRQMKPVHPQYVIVVPTENHTRALPNLRQTHGNLSPACAFRSAASTWPISTSSKTTQPQLNRPTNDRTGARIRKRQALLLTHAEQTNHLLHITSPLHSQLKSDDKRQTKQGIDSAQYFPTG